MSAQDPFAKYGGQADADPFAKYGGKADAAGPSLIDRGVDAVLNFAKGANRTANPLSEENRAGLTQLVTHPLDTAKAAVDAQGKLADEAKKSFDNGDYLTGIRHAVSYFLPLIGPSIDAAGNKAASGQVAEGLGEGAGIGASLGMAAREPAPPAPNARMVESAQNLYKNAIKGGLKSQINTTPEEVGAMVDTGLANRIPVSSAGADKLTGLVQDLGSKTQQLVDASPGTVNKYKVASRLNDVAADASRQVNPQADLNAIANSGNEFLKTQPAEIPNSDAQALKQGTYRQLGDKAYGEMKTAEIQAQKALARGIKEELETQIPELKDINAQQGSLLDLNDVLQRAVNKASNNRSGWLKESVASTAGKVLTGNTSVGVAAAVLRHMLGDPEVASRLAIAINNAQQMNPGKYGRAGMPAAVARVTALADSLQPKSNPND